MWATINNEETDNRTTASEQTAAEATGCVWVGGGWGLILILMAKSSP